MKHVVDLSIIIVSYNTRELVKSCLMSLSAAKGDSDQWEVIVVDNASVDGTVEEVSKIKFQNLKLTFIKNKTNIGFAAGNNVGIRQSKGNYILLLNSDTEVSKGAIQEILRFMDANPKIGVATAQLVLPDDSMDQACHRGFPTPWASLTYFLGLERLFPKTYLFGQYHQGFKDLSKPHEIDSPSGAFFMVRREVIDTVGLLDEDYFMYGEDLDWAYRIKKAGWKIFFYPAVTVLHHKKQSGRESMDAAIRRQTQKHFYGTMRLFYKKHYQHRYGWFTSQLILFGIKLLSFI